MILGVLRRREKQMLGNAGAALKKIGAATQETWKLDPERMRLLGEFIQNADDVLGIVLKLKAEDLAGLKTLIELMLE